jgi:hypothetical protein
MQKVLPWKMPCRMQACMHTPVLGRSQLISSYISHFFLHSYKCYACTLPGHVCDRAFLKVVIVLPPIHPLRHCKNHNTLQSHRLTTQYCMWDHYKMLPELGPSQRTNLARLNACLLARFQLSLTSLKVGVCALSIMLRQVQVVNF